MSYEEWKPSSDFRIEGYPNHLIFVTNFQEKALASHPGRVQDFRYLWKENQFWLRMGGDQGSERDLFLK